jgi:iron complex outermembrane receptor protein
MKAGCLAGAGLIGLMLASAVHAQDAAGTRLTDIVVEGGGQAGGTGPVDGYVAKETATGSKTALPLKRVPQSVSVVGREELDDRTVINKVDEALRYTPGVAAEPFGSDPDTDWIYIRGFDASQKGILLDGLPLYSHGFGNFQIDPFALDRVEILKGPASVLYGGTNPGGVVNLTRKRPMDEPYVYTEAGINDNGNGYVAVDLSDKLTEDGVVSYRLTGKAGGGDNYSDYSEEKRGFIMPQFTFAPDDGTSFTVYSYLGALDQVHVGNGFLPYVGTVVDAPFGRIPRDAYYGEPSIDDGTVVQKMVGYELSHELENGLTLSQNLRYGHLDKSEAFPYPNGYVGGVPTGPDFDLARIGFEAESEVDTFTVDNRLEGEFDLGATTHQFLVGLDYKYYRLDHVQACCGATPISAIDPDYGVPQGDNFVYLDEVITQQQVGIYAQDQIRFGEGWLLTLNGRYDWVNTKDEAIIGNSYDSSDRAASGRAGLAYEFANGVTPYVSAASFFNPVIGLSATTAFEPEKGHQVEAGVKYEPTFMDAVLTASVFQITRRNVPVTIPGTFLQEQRGEVTSTGVELEGKANLNESWKLLSSFSLTDLEVTEDLDPALIGKTPVIVPRTQASLWVDYTVPTGSFEGVSLGAGVRYQGESWADNLNTAKVPSATLVDAAIRYEKNDWNASLNVANLFDRNYVKGCQGLTVCGYGDGRTITLKIGKTW